MFFRKMLLKKYKVKVKKNPVESMVCGIFLWKKLGEVKLDLTWILHFSGSITRVLGKNEFHSVKTVEIAKRCRFFVAGLFPLWYHDSG